MSAGLSSDIFFGKYNSGGNEIWADSLSTPQGDYGYGIALSPDNSSIYITGYTSGELVPGQAVTTGTNDLFISKYDVDGTAYTAGQSIINTKFEIFIKKTVECH